MSDLEDINHPKHYTAMDIRCHSCGDPIECIDIKENFESNLADAIKYIWRCNYKGNRDKDLKKAIWYLERALERGAINEQ